MLTLAHSYSLGSCSAYRASELCAVTAVSAQGTPAPRASFPPEHFPAALRRAPGFWGMFFFNFATTALAARPSGFASSSCSS